MSRLVLLSCFAGWLLCAGAGAQEAAPADAGPIQDNSFLIEEAYNQEARVVQHISAFLRSDSGDWTYAFTQEWPVQGLRHQFSYTFALTGVEHGSGRGTGLGDLALNYRLQAVGSGASRLAVAPRLSLLLPTGSARRGRGAGGAGLQFNLPLSLALSDRLVTHVNAGATLVPEARNARDEQAGTTAVNLGQSVIWLARPRLNFMLELSYLRTQSVVARDRVDSTHSLLLSPGLRWAHDLRSGLQIVPGLALPIGIGPSRGEVGLLAYLSFEHPFGRRR